MLRGEVDVLLQAVRVVDLVVEGLAGRLVVGVHPDDVDHVIARVALGPRHRVPPPARREVEAELLAGNRAHRRDDALPVRLPRRGIGAAPVGVGRAVHLPAEHDHRVRDAQPHQTLGEPGEVVVVLTGRTRPEQGADLAVGDPLLVALQHRYVQDEHPVRVRPLPLRPGFQERGGALDVHPQIARQVGVAHAQLGPAEPARQFGHAADPVRSVVQIRAVRRVARRPPRPGGGAVDGVLAGGRSARDAAARQEAEGERRDTRNDETALGRHCSSWR